MNFKKNFQVINSILALYQEQIISLQYCLKNHLLKWTKYIWI